MEDMFCNMGDVMPRPEMQPHVLAMAYVPVQHLDQVYEVDTALDRGTLFPELDKPFLAGGMCNV